MIPWWQLLYKDVTYRLGEEESFLLFGSSWTFVLAEGDRALEPTFKSFFFESCFVGLT